MKDLPDGRYIIFENGERVQGQPGTLNYVIEKFVEYAVRIETRVSVAKFNRQALTVGKLWESDETILIAELQRRLSIPLGVLLLSFIAVPLAQIAPRGGVYGNMLVGFLIYFSYGNLLRVSQSWVTNGTIPAWLGALGVNVLLLLIGGFLVARLYGWQWLIMKIGRKVS
jgi:lipopolysaccharide export system permease protein